MTARSRRSLLGTAFGLGVGGVLAAVLGPAGRALAQAPPLKFHRIVRDPQNASGLEKEHLITLRLPVIAEDGANVPLVVSMEHHPMEPDHYIKSLQVLNFEDPVVSKGVYRLTPLNGQAYLSLQIRSDGGDAEVWCVAECSKHGRWAASKTVKVSLGGC